MVQALLAAKRSMRLQPAKLPQGGLVWDVLKQSALSLQGSCAHAQS